MPCSVKVFASISLLITSCLLFQGCSEPEGLTLVKRGKTDYVISIDPSAPASVRMAASDLKDYFEKVGDVSFNIVENSQVPDSRYISLGTTAASEAAGLNASTIPMDGFMMVTRGKNLFILGPDTPDGQVNSKGGTNNGTSNGVYTFIEEFLCVRWLMPGETGEEYDAKKTIRIPLLDRTDHSRFDFRTVPQRDTGPLEDEWDRRMKLYKVAPMEHNHNWIQTVPASLYDEHPEWFAMHDGKRTPPIGNYKLETTNQEMVQYFAGRIMETFRKNPQRRWYSLSPSDGRSWSESPESLALTETEPNGNPSVTPLILTFYNDVARIVGKEFPDHMLGGYIYGNFRYPPSDGLEVEPNLAFMIPNGPAYGFKLYRPSVQEDWASRIWIPEWSELSKKYGFDIYYYDLPISLVQPDGIVTPPAPDLLNFTFKGMVKYGFKGGFVYGRRNWPAYAPGNYAIARLNWDPTLDAHEILDDFYRAAYGEEGGAYVGKFFHLLDSAFNRFYNENQSASYTLNEDHLKEIYAANYSALEGWYLKAAEAKKKPSQQRRLELLGQVLSLLQWNLRDYGFVSPGYNSPLTLNNDQIDELLSGQDEVLRLTGEIDPGPIGWKVEMMPPLTGAGSHEVTPVPVSSGMTMLLHVHEEGQVKIHVPAFDRKAEFIQYLVSGETGEKIATGVVARGRTFRFEGKAGNNYLLTIPARNATGKVEVEGAAVAYRTTGKTGLQIDGAFLDGPAIMYFYVPEGTRSFNLILGKRREGTKAELFSPGGRKAGELDARRQNAAHLLIRGNQVQSGFWKVVLEKSDGIAMLSLGDQLPQWITPDPGRPLKVTDK